MKRVFKIIAIIAAIFICLPLILQGLITIFYSIFMHFEMSEEEIQKIIREAKNKKEVGICYKIGTVKSNTKWMCIAEVATETKNENLCEKIPSRGTDWRDGCYREVAIAKKEVNLCEKIKREYDKEECYAGIALATYNLNLCERIESPYRDTCFYKIAIDSLDEKICDEIEDYDTKINCIREVKKGKVK